ncbi:MAG: phage portal protein, partial [Caldilineaceae bacterium]|nr:phage portal protein [Caldilineaceae bacterium]
MQGLLVRWLAPSERRKHPGESGDWDRIFGRGWSTPAGVDVSPESALTSAVVFACVRVLAESVASLPLLTYRRTGRGKERATTHPLYGLLHTQPNPEMTSFTWREWTMGYLCRWGNAISEIEWGADG